MPRGVFVTGTDTSVGKTVASAALLCRFRRYAPVRYWKPIQTGTERDDDTAEVIRLAGAAPGEVFSEGVRLPRPLSPHLAARLHGCTIDIGPLVDAFRRTTADATWIVEGAGGALVPINDDALMIDLMRRLGLPVAVVARTALGTINHTLLTVEALRRRALEIAGVIMVGAVEAGARDAIEQYGRVPVVETIPVFNPLDPDPVATWAATALGLDTLLEGNA